MAAFSGRRVAGIVGTVSALLVLAGFPSFRPIVHSQENIGSSQELRRGIGLVEASDFAAAGDVLEAVVAGLRGRPAEARELARAELYLGVARLYLAGDDEARRLFSAAQMHDPTLQPAADAMPRRVMALWEEARGLGALRIVTEPAGATVVVDGEVQGAAPIDVAGLTPGGRRVTLTLDGYVDDTRVVSVTAGRAERLRIDLTPALEESQAADAQVESAGMGATGGAAGGAAAGAEAGGGLGTGAVVGIVGAAAGGAVGIGVAAGGGDSSPPGPTAPPATATPPVRTAADDRAVLIEFYNAMDGPNWRNSSNWNSSEPLGTWYGVSTDGNGRVTRLDFVGNGLSGSIPSFLDRLTNLEWLILYGEGLTGSIPSSLSSLANLQVLSLGDNDLTGSIPSSLGNLTSLVAFNVFLNRLTGSIPAALCRFEEDINPQQGGVHLPCAQSSSASAQGSAALSVRDARVQEAAGAAVAFAVTLSGAASDPVTVRYATRDGSARAGEDYAAATGTLTFEAGESSKTVAIDVLDDAHDESEETFVLALSNVSGARLEDAEATGTIENADPLPAALLARFGRASAQHVVEQVEARMAQPREPGFRARFAGRDVGPGMAGDFALDFLSQFGRPAGTSPLGASPMASHASGAGIGPPGMTGQDLRMGGAASLRGPKTASGAGEGLLGAALPGGDLLSGSEFELNRERHGGVVSVWSRSARSSFGGRQGALSLDGDVRTTMLGADYTRGRLVAGLSLARSQGLGGYGGRHAGRVESSVTGLYPWLGYRVNDRVSVWGVTGYGAGAMRLTPERATALESGLSMAMAAAGTRGELVGSRAGGGFALAFKADALWVGTSVDGVDSAAGRLSATEAAVTRVRTGIEGSRGFTLGGRMSLTPSVELGLRQDGGDAETGTGVDVVGGLAFADSSTGLSLDVQMRTLVAHQADGFTDRGMSLSFGWDPTPSSPLGLAARVAPSWGGPAQGSEALWGGGPLSRSGTYGGPASAGRVDAELGYGLPVARRFVGTPRVGFGSSAYGRNYRLGYSLGALGVEKLDFELGVETHRRESPWRNGSDFGVVGRAGVRW